jgi:hypothetical protein
MQELIFQITTVIYFPERKYIQSQEEIHVCTTHELNSGIIEYPTEKKGEVGNINVQFVLYKSTNPTNILTLLVARPCSVLHSR